jgi:catechol 2,3-dioxygenase-like lactoylglutathione lyase family enzyme
MLNYATVGSNDLPRAVAFYESLLKEYGWQTASRNPDGGQVFAHPSGSLFGVVAPRDGRPATVGNGTMIGFNVASIEQVAAFHALAMELGATDEGAPGNRGDDKVQYYFGYIRDLDGNKLCAYHIPAST